MLEQEHPHFPYQDDFQTAGLKQIGKEHSYFSYQDCVCLDLYCYHFSLTNILMSNYGRTE